METVLTRLETKIAELLSTCQQLRHDNVSLRTRETHLLDEYQDLKQKHAQAVLGVETMIDRLKQVEGLV